MNNKTEIEKRNILRQNNAESNAITKECIESALIQLMEEKNFLDISITDITKRAGVSRNAYYRNYDSKEDILSKYLQNIIYEMGVVLKSSDPIKETSNSWRLLLGVIKKYSSQYQMLLKAGYGEKLREEYIKSMNENVSSDNYQLYYSNCYWASAICGIISEWVQNGMQLSIEEMSSIGAALMTDGIKTINTFGNHCD